MKLHRVVAISLAFVFLFSSFGAAPVVAETIDQSASTCAVAGSNVSSVEVSHEAKSNLIKMTVINKTGGYLSLSFRSSTGLMYFFSVAPGKQGIFMPKGKYSYTVSAICGSKSGNITIKGNRSWKWWCKKAK